MKTTLLLLLALTCASLSSSFAQSNTAAAGAVVIADSAGHAKAIADSTKRAKAHADSVKMEKLFAIAQYPYVKGSKWSGVIPVDNPTEVPDPNRQYKLLFELSHRNADSLSKEINESLDEVARVINLHYASGIPGKNIIPVIVVHGPAIQAVMTNEAYQKKHKMDNPNIKLVHDLANIGAKFIACGQAMAFSETTRDQLLPEVKVSLTAQTVLSNYQLQGYVLYSIDPSK